MLISAMTSSVLCNMRRDGVRIVMASNTILVLVLKCVAVRGQTYRLLLGISLLIRPCRWHFFRQEDERLWVRDHDRPVHPKVRQVGLPPGRHRRLRGDTVERRHPGSVGWVHLVLIYSKCTFYIYSINSAVSYVQLWYVTLHPVPNTSISLKLVSEKEWHS